MSRDSFVAIFKADLMHAITYLLSNLPAKLYITQKQGIYGGIAPSLKYNSGDMQPTVSGTDVDTPNSFATIITDNLVS